MSDDYQVRLLADRLRRLCDWLMGTLPGFRREFQCTATDSVTLTELGVGCRTTWAVDVMDSWSDFSDVLAIALNKAAAQDVDPFSAPEEYLVAAKWLVEDKRRFIHSVWPEHGNWSVLLRRRDAAGSVLVVESPLALALTKGLPLTEKL